MSDISSATDRSALRAEHDALASRLGTRRSVDASRMGLLLVFAGLIGAGTCAALAFDRWGTLPVGYVRKTPPGGPFFLYLSSVVTVALLGCAITALLRARRMSREERALFDRLRWLRRALELEP